MDNASFLDSEMAERNEIKFPVVMVVPYSKTGEPVTKTNTGIRILGRIPKNGLIRRFYVNEKIDKYLVAKILDEKLEPGTVLSITAEEKPVAIRSKDGKTIDRWEFEYYIRYYSVRRRPGQNKEDVTPAALTALTAISGNNGNSNGTNNRNSSSTGNGNSNANSNNSNGNSTSSTNNVGRTGTPAAAYAASNVSAINGVGTASVARTSNAVSAPPATSPNAARPVDRDAVAAQQVNTRKEAMPETMSADDLLQGVPFLTSSLKKSFG